MAANSTSQRRAASPAANGQAIRPLKVVETVTSDGSWCCRARPPSLPPSPNTRASRILRSKELRNVPSDTSACKEHHKTVEDASKLSTAESTQEAVGSKLEKKIKPTEIRRSGEAFENGEVASLLKQGFISGGGTLERGCNASPFKIRLSPGRVSPLAEASSPPISNSTAPNFAKLNSLLNTGLHSQSSPPIEKVRASPTLFEMMTHEQDKRAKVQCNSGPLQAIQDSRALGKQLSLQERLLSANSPGSKFNDPFSSDLKLSLTSNNEDGPSVTLNVHRQILAAHSRFFAAKLSEKWSKQPLDGPYVVQISDCEDVEAYVETLRLMYCTNLKRKLLKESVSRVLSILKVSAAIVFEAGVLSCLEYLEAVPWAEEEEEKVTALLSQLRLESIGAGEVLKRLSTTEDNSGCSQDILPRLLHLVTKGTDEKARREMKRLVSKMLRENAALGKDSNDLSKESLYSACHGCLDSLLHFFTQAATPESGVRSNEDRGMLMAQIIRQADNLNWLLDILIDRQIADEFVKLWAYQKELVELHAQVPLALGRYEVSRLTARLCIAVGQGEVMTPKETRFQLLHNWLQPLIDDFGWMQRACRGLDRKVVEEGLSQTILTLPLKQQQTILIAWFDRFLKSGDDCPNLQRAFEIWWRRTFVRPQVDSCVSPSHAFLRLSDTPTQKVGALHQVGL